MTTMNDIIWWCGAIVLGCSMLSVSFFCIYATGDYLITKLLYFKKCFHAFTQIITNPRAWEEWKKQFNNKE